jgi:hypothetical protein
MKVEFDKSFERSLGKIHDPRIYFIDLSESLPTLKFLLPSLRNPTSKNFPGTQIISD